VGKGRSRHAGGQSSDGGGSEGGEGGGGGVKEEEEVEFPWSSEEGLTPWHCPFCKVTVNTASMDP